MATSFITMDEVHGFWIGDSLMQVVCWGLVNTIDNSKVPEEEWMKGEFREHIYNNSQGLFVGFMHLRLGEFLNSPSRKEAFKNCIERTKKFFFDKGEAIPIEELNDFQLIEETKAKWILPLEVTRVIKVLNYLEDMVDGKLTIKGSDKIDYKF